MARCWSATAGMLGATEVILATAVGGVAYSLLCGQPMSILASTGSVVTYTAILYQTCMQQGLLLRHVRVDRHLDLDHPHVRRRDVVV